MATEPDDIVVEAATPANDDRSVEIVGGHRSDFKSVPSIAQASKKAAGDCRMVVEFPFSFSAQFLKDAGEEIQGRKFHDGVEFLRKLAEDWGDGKVDLSRLTELSAEHSDNGVRVEAAK